MARFEVSQADRKVLEGWLRMPTLSQQLGLRARAVLASAEGDTVRAVASRLKVSPDTVAACRRRYREGGVDALRTRARAGRPPKISWAKEQAVVAATLRTPKNATHWSVRRLAREVGVPSATVHRIWQKYGLQPQRLRIFKFSTNPEFTTKLADIVGLYMDPPARAIVLCVDEKSQIQALNRTQPLLPMRPGLPARMTHDYLRHGTTSLFAALEVVSGKIHGRCYPRHTHVEFTDFLQFLAKRYRLRELHLICDNYGTHKHPEVREWLQVHRNFHIHFTPTSASWLNLVERWFALITSQAIRGGSFDSLKQLEAAILRYIDHWNENPRPFRWTKSAAEIKRSLETVAAIYENAH
jgi:transposase